MALRVLMIEAREENAELAIEALRAGGLDPAWKRVESSEQVTGALDEGSWDLVLSDSALPAFDGMAALRLVRERDEDVPFIFVCGAIGEDLAAEMMRAGADDVVLRDRLWRLVPAIQRELRETPSRRERHLRSNSGRRADDARFRNYFELGLVGMVTSAPDGAFLEINNRFCELLGYSRAELLSKTVHDVTHPEDLAADLANLEAVRSGERDRWSLDKRFVHSDGRVVDAIASTAAIRRPDGSIDHLIAIVEDITPQKLAERELLGRERSFKAVVENTPDLITRFSRDLRRQYVNPAIERLIGRPSHELIGKTMRELNFDHRFIDPLERALTEVFATGAETTLEVLLPGPAAERVYQARVVPELGLTEEVEFALVISRDITTIRRDQERLLSLTGEIELLLASTYEGICAADAAGRCTLVNKSAASMLGYTPAEMMGEKLHELLHDRRDGGSAGGSPCRAEVCPLMMAAEDGKPAHIVNEVFWRKDGTSFPVEIFISPILGDDKAARGMVASFIDVTERRNLQAELERVNRLVGLGRVASAMSHQFNNVLMGIQPFAEILLRSSAEPRVLDAAQRIIQSVKRGRNITEELRAFTRPVPPIRTPTDVRSWLSECSSELERLVPANVQLSVDIAGTPLAIEVDRTQITHVLSNLVVNAGEAFGSRKGSIRITARLTTDSDRFQSDESFVRFSVVDDGPGIDPQHLSRIFEPFFTTKESGTGLGLAIARQIVTLHGGHLFMESAVGTGTTVQFFLPATTKTAQPPPDAGVRASVRRRWPREILLVEDDEAVASGVVALLEDEKVKVLLAGDGAEALKILQSYKPQALVIDINLPDCNGFDLYEQITASIGPLPVVFASGHADATRLESLKTSAAVRMLTKPYTIDALLDTLETLAQNGV